MKQFFAAFILFFITVNESYIHAQKGKVFLYPIDYNYPDGKVRSSHGQEKEGDPWVVFSDRKNNVIYQEANYNIKANVAAFKDKFYVINEQGDFLQLAKYDFDAIDNKTRKLKSTTEIVGWMPKKNLLLWKKAIVNKRKITKKAIVVIKGADALKNPAAYIDTAGTVVCYNSPDPSNSNKIENSEIRMFKFLFILKEENDLVLISRQSKFSAQSTQNILGWVPKSLLTIWETRLSLQPNFDDQAKSERIKAGIISSVFLNPGDAEEFFRTLKLTDTIGVEKTSDKKWAREIKRLPVIDDTTFKKSKVVETNYITGVLDGNGKAIFDKEKADKKIGEILGLVGELKKINIVYVVDGGPDMASYLQEISSAIQTVKNNITSELKEVFEISMGSVIYRDYAENDCGSKSTSESKLSKDYTKLMNFINEEGRKPSCSGDKDPSQAMREGIYKGLQLFEGKDGQSNYIILVAGAADSEENIAKSKVSENALKKMYGQVMPNFIAYQYNQASNQVFRDFQKQVRAIIMSGNEEMLELVKRGSPNEKIETFSFEKDYSKSDYNSYKIVEDGNFMRKGYCNFPNYGQSISSAVFLKEMGDLLENITKSSLIASEDIQKSFISGEKTKLTNAMRLTLLSLNVKISESEVKSLYEKGKYQFAVKCYAPLKSEKLKNDLFERVLFFTADELDALIKNLEDLDQDDSENLAIALEAALKRIAASYFGGKESDEAIKKMSGSQIVSLMTGVESKSGIFKAMRSVEDIKDKSKFDSSKLLAIKTKFNEALDNLRKAKTDQNFFYLEDGQSYYWIPERFLGNL